jgi:hypothetical protein
MAFGSKESSKEVTILAGWEERKKFFKKGELSAFMEAMFFPRTI